MLASPFFRLVVYRNGGVENGKEQPRVALHFRHRPQYRLSAPQVDTSLFIFFLVSEKPNWGTRFSHCQFTTREDRCQISLLKLNYPLQPSFSRLFSPITIAAHPSHCRKCAHPWRRRRVQGPGPRGAFAPGQSGRWPAGSPPALQMALIVRAESNIIGMSRRQAAGRALDIGVSE